MVSPSYTANNATSGTVKYYKLFTVTPTGNYTDGAYRFTVASRQGICEITYRIISNNNLYINTKTTGSFTGSSSIASNIKTYFYKDTENAITKMEVYCTIPAYDNVRFYKTWHNNHFNTVTWDFKSVSALPTDYTSELTLTNKNCLRLSGGTLSNADYAGALKINRVSTASGTLLSVIEYLLNGSRIGAMGFDSDSKLRVRNSENKDVYFSPKKDSDLFDSIEF